MALSFSTTVRSARNSTTNTQAGPSCIIEVRSGVRPANGDGAATGTVLVSFTGNASGLGTVTNGVLTLNAIAQATAVATGTATWFRIKSSGGTTVVDGDVGVSTGELRLNDVNIVSGGPSQITSGTITEAT